jgi:hypothetical protein
MFGRAFPFWTDDSLLAVPPVSNASLFDVRHTLRGKQMGRAPVGDVLQELEHRDQCQNDGTDRPTFSTELWQAALRMFDR